MINILSKDYKETGYSPKQIREMQEGLVKSSLEIPESHFLMGVGNVALQAADATTDDGTIIYYLMMFKMSLEDVQSGRKVTNEEFEERLSDGETVVLIFQNKFRRDMAISALEV